MSDHYFQELNRTLREQGIHYPTLVVDKQRLDRNIDRLIDVINMGFNYRIVAKSLPSITMLQYIMHRTGTNRLMSFHLPFLMHVAEHIPAADILLGKPMPISAVKHFYQWHKQQSTLCFNPDKQLQWLVDSTERLQEYQQYADSKREKLRINLEIDVGLHRGGFSDKNEFVKALRMIQQSDYLTLGGLMGYEAHVTKIPGIIGGPEKAFDQAMAIYQQFVELIRTTYGDATLDGLCLNAGGSSTYPLYQQADMINEIATASALVKPTDFDVYTLEHHEPAAFIATPILKDVKNPNLPMAPGISAFLRAIGQMPKRGVFIYGGNWLAQPHYPEHSKRSDILGHSSNQELYEIPANSPVKREDFFFFRPTQSEAVFLQFGHIAVYDQGKISDYWPIFSYPADQMPVERPIASAEVHHFSQ